MNWSTWFVAQPVGCDKLIGSAAVADACGVCGGDGTTCTTVRGVVRTPNLVAGYNDVVLIPKGATHIRIQEKNSSNNYLGQYKLKWFQSVSQLWIIQLNDCIFKLKMQLLRSSVVDFIRFYLTESLHELEVNLFLQLFLVSD